MSARTERYLRQKVAQRMVRSGKPRARQMVHKYRSLQQPRRQEKGRLFPDRREAQKLRQTPNVSDATRSGHKTRAPQLEKLSVSLTGRERTSSPTLLRPIDRLTSLLLTNALRTRSHVPTGFTKAPSSVIMADTTSGNLWLQLFYTLLLW